MEKRLDNEFTQKDRNLFQKTASFACDYMSTAKSRRVFPSPEAVAKLEIFDEPLPQKQGNGDEIIEMLHSYGSPATVAQTGGRYYGFVNGSVYSAALAAKWLSDVWDQNPALYVISPIVSKLEQICENWLKDLFGLPQQTVAGLVGGTSTATLCGLAAGRFELLRRKNWNVNQQGLRSAPQIRIVAGQQAHGTVYKALALLGFGKDEVELASVDDQGAIDIHKLPDLDDSTLLILQAGNVNTGSFDPLDQICDIANKAGAWVHIDGAFGLWAAASASKKHLTDGLAKADSWSVDGHKTLNTPYDCGIILCRHPETLIEAMQTTGSYIQYGNQRDSMLYTPEMSRRSRAVELWATLRFLGKEGIEQLVDRLCYNAQVLADQLAQKGFRILNRVVFNQVLVACDDPETTLSTLQLIQNSGDCWCGTSNWNGEPVIRISVCSWKTDEDDLQQTVNAFVNAKKAAETGI